MIALLAIHIIPSKMCMKKVDRWVEPTWWWAIHSSRNTNSCLEFKRGGEHIDHAPQEVRHSRRQKQLLELKTSVKWKGDLAE